jgi:hypothetical protein
MPALGALLSAADRERLLARMRELSQTGALLEEPGQQRPPPIPVAVFRPVPERDADGAEAER